MTIVKGVFVILAVLLIGRLGWVQIVWGPELAAQAEEQRARVYVDPARRGEIIDREGNQLAYTMQARSLTVSPMLLRDELRQQQDLQMRVDGENVGKSPEQISDELDDRVQDVLERMSREIPEMIEDAGAVAEGSEEVKDEEILDKLEAETSYEVLVRNVDPDVAAEIAATFHGVAADHQDIRQYPNGAIGENIIGKVSMDGQGQFGFEASADSTLSGINGRSTEDVSTDGQVIPGTLRDVVPAVDGAGVELTLDLDLQTYVQQLLEQAKSNSQANSAEAVVLDVATGDVLAMANTDTIDPNGNISRQLEAGKDFENKTISHPFEPGSVAKIITAAATLEEGLTTPDEVHQVPGSINMAGVTVKDAWDHGVVPYTTTGVFGKSSNVGTLMLADRLGEEKFADYLSRFGIGQPTGIELPNESSGLLPPLEQWSGGTFANLPIGQGMSLTTLQMASIYQALANDGMRIEPRIIESVTGPVVKEQPTTEPKRTQVVSPETADTVVFCGTFTAGGLEIAIEDGAVRIVQEGKHRKFIAEVEHRTFSGEYAAEKSQRVLYVTERAVFELADGGLTLTEIAPGVEIKVHSQAILRIVTAGDEPLDGTHEAIDEPQALSDTVEESITDEAPRVETPEETAARSDG